MNVKQVYTSPVKFYKDGKEQILSEKEYSLEELGSRQIDVIWRYYKDNIWISNIGYVAEVNIENIAKRFPDDAQIRYEEFLKNYKETEVVFRNLLYDERLLLKICTFIPRDSGAVNRYGDKQYGVELYVDQVKEPLHMIVAKVFLGKKSGDGLVIHHIDNNSFNNSVTNLICVSAARHQERSSDGTNILHPYSPWKNDRTLKHERRTKNLNCS